MAGECVPVCACLFLCVSVCGVCVCVCVCECVYRRIQSDFDCNSLLIVNCECFFVIN